MLARPLVLWRAGKERNLSLSLEATVWRGAAAPDVDPHSAPVSAGATSRGRGCRGHVTVVLLHLEHGGGGLLVLGEVLALGLRCHADVPGHLHGVAGSPQQRLEGVGGLGEEQHLGGGGGGLLGGGAGRPPREQTVSASAGLEPPFLGGRLRGNGGGLLEANSVDLKHNILFYINMPHEVVTRLTCSLEDLRPLGWVRVLTSESPEKGVLSSASAWSSTASMMSRSLLVIFSTATSSS